MLFKNIKVNGLNIFYREAGDEAAPKLILLHGFPASSHQYRDMIPALADRFHVIAPDYPGFGNSDMPDPEKFFSERIPIRAWQARSVNLPQA